MTQHEQRPIQPREKLDFQLDTDIPRFWNGGDAFKTRLFDAMSLTFPLGERYFISSVRNYRDQITDPHLLQEVKDFTRQEAQHGMVHTQYNDLLKRQGLAVVDWSQRFINAKFNWQLRRWSKAFNLSYTAAAEHLTAMMCTTFFQREDIVGPFDPRIRALYTWHAIEEVEHKAVAYDVLTKVAKVGYLMRIMGLVYFSIEYPIAVMHLMSRMLKDDGFSFFQRLGIWAKGLWWLYKPGGVFMPALGYYLSYYKPGFHPWQHKEMGLYDVWMDSFKRSGDPIEASESMLAAVRGA